jgi:quercetin dioxygenase-like cupin family protein
MSKPYDDSEISKDEFFRNFKKDVLEDELVWHRDEKDRIITVLLGKGWEFQEDNSLPRALNEGDQIYVPAKTYHRIKRGTTDLMIKIEEL